ncbi:MAG: hypothetical protein DMG68_10300 [Acidobacteria bacterium]|jgi:hypothetical protein|nr:MAG: hypothetical protein DMG68_10300 [Acidobacteriota bacterium]
MRRPRLVILLVLGFLICGLQAGGFLVINDPQKSDVIVVLAGETDYRPARGLELLNQGYGTRLLIDAPARERIFSASTTELAQHWAQSLPQAQLISICPIYGLSTKDETHEAVACANRLGARRILLITSDYHTRRALSTFQHEVPQVTFSMAAAYDPRSFGTAWWQHREWAKTAFYELLRLMWWECVDRWH